MDEANEQRQQRTQAARDAAVGRDVVAVVVPRAGRAVITEIERDKCDSGLHRAVVIEPGLYWLPPRKREYSR